MAIRAVAFDLDGLMFNTEDVFDLAGTEFLRRRGMEMTDVIRDGMIGRRPPEAFAHLKKHTGIDGPMEELLAETWGLFNTMLDEHLRPMPFLFDLLDHLDRLGLPKAVATSSPRSHLEGLLSRFDLLPRFTAALTMEDVERGKPDPDIYLKTAARLGVAPSEMLVLEDSGAGTQAGAAAGAVVVAVPHRYSAKHDFGPAAHIASGLGDPWIIERLG